MDLDDVLPLPRWRIAASRLIDASPDTVWAALIDLPMRSIPAGFGLTLLRHLPAVLARRERRVRADDTFLNATPIPVVFADRPAAVISAGASQAWKFGGGSTPPLVSGEHFAGWASPGWLKVAMGFRLEAVGAGTLLSTETRITATDARTARAFAPYWWAIRAGSVLIRREVIRAVARTVERRGT